MSGRGFKVMRAQWWCAAAASALLPAPLLAQNPPAPGTLAPAPPEPAQLDPNAPLDPMPGLGIAWPELDAKDTAQPATVPATPQTRRRTAAAAAGDIRYTVEVQGLES